ncbi:dihydrofolate reductase [Mesobacillus campisalis]|uniref:Dihydrofolate reductase n=1 Tax=Mesobacillus campisalis TaxID=1408103 RepID=A0A0M2SUA6_9BACI|nr:D-2-hydroxyacid dehydrogenase [Mesobacillus campisalis]KKK37728.1 dihydrofolate reductase [Mesobacillus campisalis]
MKIQNIVVASPMYKEIQQLIDPRKLHNNFRYVHEDDLTQEDLDWADALAAFNLKKTFDLSQVKWVHSLGAGVDKFLFKKEWPGEVLLTRTVCSFGQRIAEYCLSYLLKDLQYHQEFQQMQERKKWQPMTPKLLNQQKVIIYGTGEIGQKAAEVLTYLGVEVYGVSLSGKEKAFFKEVMTIETHFSKLKEMDYLINTLPLTERTEHLFATRIFGHLKGAGFINVGRGATVNEDALLQALDEEKVRFAVLDVFAKEPLPAENKLWEHPNVSITPHISAVTTPEEGVDCFIETLRNVEAGKQLTNKVDPLKGF